jgi:hypothetical protein
MARVKKRVEMAAVRLQSTSGATEPRARSRRILHSSAILEAVDSSLLQASGASGVRFCNRRLDVFSQPDEKL